MNIIKKEKMIECTHKHTDYSWDFWGSIDLFSCWNVSIRSCI